MKDDIKTFFAFSYHNFQGFLKSFIFYEISVGSVKDPMQTFIIIWQHDLTETPFLKIKINLG